MDGEIQRNKGLVHDREGRANQYGEKLESTIKEEGLFCVEWYQ